jgi:hypothetical protein
MVVCDWELAEARKKDALDRARVRGEEPPAELLAEERGLHSSIEADVRDLLQGKTYVELEGMRSQIESQMRSGTAKVVEYWEAVLKRLHIYKAKVSIIISSMYLYLSKNYMFIYTDCLLQIQACLKEIHAKMLRKHLQRLEEPLEGENESESDHDLELKEENSEHDVNGTYFLSFVFMNFAPRMLGS